MRTVQLMESTAIVKVTYNWSAGNHPGGGDMYQIIAALLQSVLKEAPHQAADVAVEKVRDHYKTKAVFTTVSSFLEAVAARKPDAAVALCTKELEAELRRGGGVAAALETVRSLLDGRTDITHDAPSYNFFHNACDVKGWALAGTRSAPYRISVEESGDGWKIRGYEFNEIPPPVLNADGVVPGPGGVCPDGYPIKVSRSRVYHVPGGRYYETTAAIRCFATATDAKAAGFFASKRG